MAGSPEGPAALRSGGRGSAAEAAEDPSPFSQRGLSAVTAEPAANVPYQPQGLTLHSSCLGRSPSNPAIFRLLGSQGGCGAKCLCQETESGKVGEFAGN